MRSFRGETENIPCSLLVKIVSQAETQEWKEEACFLFVSEGLGEGSHLSGILIQGSTSEKRRVWHPVIYVPGDISLSVGDILLIEPEGVGTLLFEKNSSSNALFLTERCNCRCLMCPQPPGDDKEDLADLSLRLISLIDLDTEVLGITGGEPTLATDSLLRVLSACRQFLPKTFLELLSNGRMFKDFTFVQAIQESAGDNLSIGIPLYSEIDTIHDGIVSAKGAYWETLEGIYNLARVGIPVELRTVVTRFNYQRLPQWAEFVYQNLPFLVHVAIMGMEPIGMALVNIDRLWIDPMDYGAELEAAVKILHRRGMNVSLYNHQLCTLNRRLWPFSRKAISEWKNVYFPECEGCQEIADCGGFFQSATKYKSRTIAAIKS